MLVDDDFPPSDDDRGISRQTNLGSLIGMLEQASIRPYRLALKRNLENRVRGSVLDYQRLLVMARD